VRVFGSITKCMVHSVQNSISTWGQIGTSLTNPGKKIEKPFPKFAH